MNILFAASECVPFCKTGGLADVVGSLAPVLASFGHDVRVMLPLYGAVSEAYRRDMEHKISFEVALGWRRQYCGIEMLKRDGVTYYFIDNQYYFGRSYIYGLGGDEFERYGFFCRAVLNALPMLGFSPDVIHAHDWQSGMIPALLKIQYSHLPFYANIKTVFTIHNLQYQGVFDIKSVQDVLGLGDSLFTPDQLECYGCANFMKAALVYADELTTVSPSYADEIQTRYYGERLDGLLRSRKQSLTGVLNGIDIQEYNPQSDPMIFARYCADDMSGKAENKLRLQRLMGLHERADVPLIGMVGRLSDQKGLDLIDYVIGDIMQNDVQLCVLGMGDARYTNLFSWAEQTYPGRIAARFSMDHELAHRIYAGADLFLMPSKFEPCGLSQMIALRYGTIPIVRETGGLRDTVLSYNEYSGAGNGFTFFNYNAHDMLSTIERAIHYYRNEKQIFATLMARGMQGDYSWTHSANEYMSLYASVTGITPRCKPCGMCESDDAAAIDEPEADANAEMPEDIDAAESTEETAAAQAPEDEDDRTGADDPPDEDSSIDEDDLPDEDDPADADEDDSIDEDDLPDEDDPADADDPEHTDDDSPASSPADTAAAGIKKKRRRKHKRH